MSRPLVHPDLTNLPVAAILHALSDPVRLAIVCELLEGRAGMNCMETTDKLRQPMAKSMRSHHYRILREGGLIASERVGVEMISQVRVAELEARFPGLLTSILDSFRSEHSRPTAITRRAAGHSS